MLDHLRYSKSLVGGESAVHLDEKFSRRPNGVANRLDERDRSDAFLVIEFVLARSEWIDFQCPIAAFDDNSGCLVKILGVRSTVYHPLA